MLTLNDFTIGETIRFGRSGGEKTLAKVVGKGRTRLQVETLESRGVNSRSTAGITWTVAPSMCEKVNGSATPAAPTTTTAASPKRPAHTTSDTEFARLARQVGLPEDCKGQTFKYGHHTLTIVGIKPSRWKFPVNVEGPQGGKYKMDVESVRRGLLQSAISASKTTAAPTAKTTRTEMEIMGDIFGVYCNLSPENLTCDGELSPRQVSARSARLHRQLHDLEREMGRKVSESEAWAWYDRNSRHMA